MPSESSETTLVFHRRKGAAPAAHPEASDADGPNPQRVKRVKAAPEQAAKPTSARRARR